jgi:hypothetical protein
MGNLQKQLVLLNFLIQLLKNLTAFSQNRKDFLARITWICAGGLKRSTDDLTGRSPENNGW